MKSSLWHLNFICPLTDQQASTLLSAASDRIYLREVDLRQVVIDGILLPRRATLCRLTSGGLLLGGELLLQPEDQGPDVSREEPGDDGLGVHLARQHVGSLQNGVSWWDGGHQAFTDSSLKYGLEESVVEVLHDLHWVGFLLRGDVYSNDSHRPGSVVLLQLIQLGLEPGVLLGTVDQVLLKLGVLHLGDLEEGLDGGEAGFQAFDGGVRGK